MSFSFGFSGDDVGDDNDIVGQNDGVSAKAEAPSQFVGLPAEQHSLDDLVGLHVDCRFKVLFQYDSYCVGRLIAFRAQEMSPCSLTRT